MSPSKSKLKKYLIRIFFTMFALIVAFNIGLIVYQMMDESLALKSAIDDRRIDELSAMNPEQFNLTIDQQPAIFYAIDSDDYAIVERFIAKGIDLKVSIDSNDTYMSPGFYARYYDKKNSEKALLVSNLKEVAESIQTAQSKLDSEFHNEIIEALDEELERLNNP
ncbi:MAG: hypothetical protein KUG78_08865 [Kangiellaceae bacterium]|nr:hypothetical protein [Kangiellaceae bacterium]